MNVNSLGMKTLADMPTIKDMSVYSALMFGYNSTQEKINNLIGHQDPAAINVSLMFEISGTEPYKHPGEGEG